VAKLVLIETIVSPSQTRSPSTDALARSRIRSPKLGTAPVANIEHNAGRCQPDNCETRKRYTDRQPPGRQRGLRNFYRGIGDDRHCAHCGKVMAADRQRQQNSTADLPLFFVAMKTDRITDCQG